jgi:Protein of unknown function (DUF1501)
MLDFSASRRSFIERCAFSAFGLTLGAPTSRSAPAAAAATARGFGGAKSVIFLQMEGAMSHIDTLDPKDGPTQGPKAPISGKGDLRFGGYLPLTAQLGDRCTIIRSMHAKTGVHAAAQYLLRTGYEQRGTVVHPAMGAWAQTLLGPSHPVLPSSVCVNKPAGHGNGFLSPAFSPLPILDPDAGLQYAKSSVSDDSLKHRLALLNDLDRSFRTQYADGNVKAYSEFYDHTLSLMASADVKVFNLNEEKNETREAYGRTKLGQGCLLARRLVESGVRFIEVGMGGWDMHTDLEDRMEENGSVLDQALSALLTDLGQRGLLQSTLVVLASEFGRKPNINSNGGRDHHPTVFSTLLAGGGVKGGFAYGSSDAPGGSVAEKPTTVMDLHATIGHALGIDPAKEIQSPSGRPFTMGNKGTVIADIMA